MSKVKTRFAPSPTGLLHIGGLRTAIYSYALAKKSGGKFVLRIEDTDQKRLVTGSVENLKNSLIKSGLKWDEYYVQTERAKQGIYLKEAKRLIESGNAFYCRCKPKNPKSEGYSNILRDPCRSKDYETGAIKLKVPDNEVLGYHDFIINKEIFWKTDLVADTTLLKSEEFSNLPTYHLAVVVDDHAMGITHVLRGHDWMPSTPIHLLVYKYLGYKRPEGGHLTDILDPDGGKLSKRKGSVSCEVMIGDGYLPEAILNYVILLGWAPKDNREIFSLGEFVKIFDPRGFQKSNPIFDRAKLDWFNGYYIRQKTDKELAKLFLEFLPKNVDYKTLLRITPLVKERLTKVSEIGTLAGFFFEKPKVKQKLLGKNASVHLKEAITILKKLREWNLDQINSVLTGLIKDKGFETGSFFMDLRVAITGSRVTPPINESIVILGKLKTLRRLKFVLQP